MNGYECFHCGQKSVIWDGDFMFEDYGLDGDGVIHSCHCTNCGATITYEIPIEPKKPKEAEWLYIDESCMTVCPICGALGCDTPYCAHCGTKMRTREDETEGE